jgi:outer membrane lipoprotein SlyB
VNAAGGAVLGGALGAVRGSTKDARRGATAGAVIGATKGVADAMKSKDEVLRNCLTGRGYRVLN